MAHGLPIILPNGIRIVIHDQVQLSWLPGISQSTDRRVMLSVPTDLPVYLAISPIDMRKSFDGLSVYVQTYLKLNPLRDGVFIFRNKSGDKVKLMYWQCNGLVVIYKCLEQGRFKWCRQPVADPSGAGIFAGWH